MAATSRQWGWHRLKPDWAERFVESAGVSSGDLVLDVGAGTGAVTGPLLESGARVVAVEAHPGRARQLRDRFGGALVVVETDARDLRLPRQPYRVVASPPFHITAPLLRRLLQPGSRLISAHMVLQHQAAVRWSGPAAPAAVRWTGTFDASAGAPIPRRAFVPPPRVNARVLVVTRRSNLRQ